jgi:hypothetical protein
MKILIIFFSFFVFLSCSNKESKNEASEKKETTCELIKDSMKENVDYKICSGNFENGEYSIFAIQETKDPSSKLKRFHINFKFNQKFCISGRVKIVTMFADGTKHKDEFYKDVKMNCEGMINEMEIWAQDEKTNPYNKIMTDGIKAIRFETDDKSYDVTFTKEQADKFKNQYSTIEI